MYGPIEGSIYTQAVTTVVKHIQSQTPIKDSLFEQAQLYFESSEKDKNTRLCLQQEIDLITKSLVTIDKKNTLKQQNKLERTEKTYKKEQARQQQKRTLRYQSVVDVCCKLLLLSEGGSWHDTQTKSAKLLGTLQLLSPGEGAKLAQHHQKLKPAYKGVLTLRLLDKLLLEDNISNQYIKDRNQSSQRYPDKEGELTLFQRDVAIPMLIGSLFQDVGLLHPEAQLLLKGEDGTLDEFRVLDNDIRLKLLKINHEQTLDYITFGLGSDQYVGNSKVDKVSFEANEKERLNFTLTLLKDAIKSKLVVGNLLKTPQIYTSVILSTKKNYNFLDLPKAGLVISKAAEGGVISTDAANGLLAIVGHFPQGYGITYIPQNEDHQDMDRYEYAIVSNLNPKDPFVPRCRVTTRNLTFITNGQSMLINKENNLFFLIARKKLAKINPARLEEILRKLVSNFEERKELDLIPRYWNPYGFFCYKKLQNLWKKA